MVVTRSQAGAEEEKRAIVFDQPPRSPSAGTAGIPPTGGAPPAPGNAGERGERDRAVNPDGRTAAVNPDGRTAAVNPDGRAAANQDAENVNPEGEDNPVDEDNSERTLTFHPDVLRMQTAADVHRPSRPRSMRSHKSTASAIARIQYEAEEKMAAIRRQQLQLEADLIQKKLAADIAALEDSNDEEDEEPAEQVQKRVHDWIDDGIHKLNALQGESSRSITLKAHEAAAKERLTRRHEEMPVKKTDKRPRIEPNTPMRERSPTPAKSTRSRDIEQLANTLEKLMKRRPPPRQATDLPLFSGAPAEWLQFKAAMKETTETYRFTPLENLARLRNCLRGEAKEAVAPLLSTSTPPEQVMNTLEQCFGRSEVIVDQMLEELKRLPKLGGSATELNTFAVKVQNTVTVLKTLKRGYLHNPMMTREVLEKLSPHQRSRWYDYAQDESENSSEPEIVLLSEFLMREANRALKYGFTTTSANKKEAPRPPIKANEPKWKKKVFTITNEEKKEDYNTSKTIKCPACEQEHTLPKCTKFPKLKNQERWDLVKKAGLCFKCITGKHRRLNCRAKHCGVSGCKLSHHQLLHNNELNTADKSQATVAAIADTKQDDATASNDEEIMAVASIEGDREVKLKICPVTVKGPRGKTQIYALFDEGSTVTLLDDQVAQTIGAKGPARSLNMHGINADRCETNSRQIKMRISGHDGKEHAISARTVSGLNLTGQSISEKLLRLDHLKDLKREELCYTSAKPQLLIGADNWQLIVTRELRLGKKNQPAASRTQLGWVIHGNLPNKIVKIDEEEVLHIVTTQQQDHLETMVKEHFDIDALGISQKTKINENDHRAVEIFEKTAKRREDGHYEVGLPWRTEDTKLPPSYNTALRRLKSLETRLDKSLNEKQQYKEQVDNLLKKGYAQKCDGSEAGNTVTWYLPHFPVKNINKPGKIRMVFDAAAKSHGKSLNDFLLEGPDLLRSLPAILFRFREEAIAVKADIQEMFLRIKIRKQDQPAQMFLWRTERESPPATYKMTSMIFGASSSPFLAHSVRNRNAKDFAESHPEAHRAITEAHYMDDFVDSYSSQTEAKKVIEQVDYVHKQAGFHLRSWNSNNSEILTEIPKEFQTQGTAQAITKDEHCEKTLGLLWDSSKDVLKFSTSLNRVNKEVRELIRPPTKREALSAVMSIYDPLGLLSCYTITAKSELQNLWRQKLDWDEPITEESAEAFAQWLRNLEHISHIELPRSYNGGSPVKNRQLHIFCDASEDAYAAAAYWRLEQDDGEVRVVLASAKAKVAPLKTQTIPRMELQAALIGARLAHHVTEEHRWHTHGITYWTDAQVVLHWIRNGSRRYTPYVAHRLGEIAELSTENQWRWVPTKQNVADLATRPGYVPKDADDLWFTGPEFLKKPENEWPQNMPRCQENNEDITEQTILHITNSEPPHLPDIQRFSSYERLIRSTARVLLFIENCKGQKKSLEVEHLEKAEKLWIQRAQEDDFKMELETLKKGKSISRSSPLYRLDPICEDDLLRVHGRIGASSVPIKTKRPIILNGRHPFTRLLVANEHKTAGHANQERVVNDLRQRYWILRLRPTVRSVTKNCAFCKMRRASPRTPTTGDLPKERLGAFQRPFSNCGLDYFGPMVVTIGRRHEKRWGALFTCLTTRAVHIELAASLSTDSALMAMRRMAARRGWPAVMYSDNGTNFKGADAELRAAYKEWEPELRELGLQHRMKWKYIPPGAPNQGGAWERLVKSVKTALAATLNQKSPKEEVLQTLITEAEYAINARPLTHVSVDHNDPEALTPNHFLIGSSIGLPTIGHCEPADRRIWRASQALADEFWRRWVREYLPNLVPRQDAAKNDRQLAEGDLVIVVDPSLPRNTWPRGIIERTYPGPDGRVRSADVRTPGGVFRRPTLKLAVLQEKTPIRTLPGPEGEDALQSSEPAVTQKGCVETTPGGDC